MEQIHASLWTMSFPMVYLIAFVLTIQLMALGLFFTRRSRKESILWWVLLPLFLVLLFSLPILVCKTVVGCTLVFGAVCTLAILFLMTPHFYRSSERFRNWFDNKQQESGAIS